MIYPNKLKYYREKAGYTQKDIATMLGYGSSTGYRWIEIGEQRPTKKQIKLLAKIMGATSKELFGDLDTSRLKADRKRKIKKGPRDRYRTECPCCSGNHVNKVISTRHAYLYCYDCEVEYRFDVDKIYTYKADIDGVLHHIDTFVLAEGEAAE